MASKVVSTKLTEEEYGKLIGLTSATGFTVSKLLKRAILARMNEEITRPEEPKEMPKVQEPQTVEIKSKPVQEKKTQEERFLYY